MISTNERKLKDWLTDSPMELADFMQMSITLVEMVYRVHQQSAFSGGLSPSNIRIRSDAKLAKLTERVEFDAAYRSPEQTSRINRTPDGRSDLYTLGVMFYEMLTGQMPFRPQAMRLLAIAAVIGPCFRLSILAVVSQCTLEDTLRLLYATEMEGMICHEDEADPGNSGESIFMFLHDQVQRMVYKIYAERNAE